MMKTVLIIICLAGVLLLTGIIIHYRFLFPHLTETQLFIALWPQVLAISVLGLSGGLLISNIKDK